MKMSLLDYYKTILEKVCFDPHLLKKEYDKAIKSLQIHESEQLSEWMRNRGLRSELISMNASNNNA